MTSDTPQTPPQEPVEPTGWDLDDPGYRAGIVDLLGVLGLAELTAFERLAADASLAPTLADRAALAGMAAAEYGHFERLRERLAELDVSIDEAMSPFVEPLAAFHAHTRPTDWIEGLVKAYVGDGIAGDFYREVSQRVDPRTRGLVVDVVDGGGHSAFVVERVHSAIADDPARRGRLALWARRLVGEALSQAQRIAAERDAMSSLIVGGVNRPGMDLAEIGRMFARLTEQNATRMAELGLTS